MILSLSVKANHIPGMNRELDRLLAQAVTRAAGSVVREARQSIFRGPKTGRIYRRARRVHQASAAGEAPANDIGNLAVHIVAVSGSTPFEKTVEVLEPYGVLLEFGTAKIAARPFVRPALVKARPGFIRDVAAALAKSATK